MSADVGCYIHQNQTGTRPDQAVCQARKRNALQDQELRNDVQKARHHQRKQINSKEFVPARKLDAGEAVGRERRDENRKNDRYAGIDDAVPDRRRKDLQFQNMLVRGKVQSGRKQSGRVWQHIAEFLKGIADHEEKRNRLVLSVFAREICFTEEEWHLVEAKMVEAEMTNFSAFGLEMLLHGEVRNYDFSNLKQLNASMGRIAGSINQIAKRCNENKSVHTNDVEQLRREFLELKADYLERVVKLLRKIY